MDERNKTPLLFSDLQDKLSDWIIKVAVIRNLLFSLKKYGFHNLLLLLPLFFVKSGTRLHTNYIKLMLYFVGIMPVGKLHLFLERCNRVKCKCFCFGPNMAFGESINYRHEEQVKAILKYTIYYLQKPVQPNGLCINMYIRSHNSKLVNKLYIFSTIAKWFTHKLCLSTILNFLIWVRIMQWDVCIFLQRGKNAT